jgi:hypothetical protein
MINKAHQIRSADVRRRQIRVMQVSFAGAAAVATFALFSAGTSNAETAVALGSVRLTDQVTNMPAAPVCPQLPQAAPGSTGKIIAVNDDDVNNPSSGDIFTQNAQDQSTASGAGTS